MALTARQRTTRRRTARPEPLGRQARDAAEAAFNLSQREEMTMNEAQEEAAERREYERRAIRTAKREGKSVTYLDTDGCEVTVTPGGHVFYNAADWY